jgi:hypothetical protein
MIPAQWISIGGWGRAGMTSLAENYVGFPLDKLQLAS